MAERVCIYAPTAQGAMNAERLHGLLTAYRQMGSAVERHRGSASAHRQLGRI